MDQCYRYGLPKKTEVDYKKTARSCASTLPWEDGAVLHNGRQPEWSPVSLTDICSLILSTISDRG